MRIDAYQCDWCSRREINPTDGWREVVHSPVASGAQVIEHACPTCWADVDGLKGRNAVPSWGSGAGAAGDASLTAVHDRLMQGVRRVYDEHDVTPGEEPDTHWQPHLPEGWENPD